MHFFHSSLGNSGYDLSKTLAEENVKTNKNIIYKRYIIKHNGALSCDYVGQNYCFLPHIKRDTGKKNGIHKNVKCDSMIYLLNTNLTASNRA